MKRITYLLVLVLSILCSCNKEPENTPLPLLQGKMMGDWIYLGDDSYGDNWYIYSDVDKDSSNYITNFKIIYSRKSREERKKYYDFVPYEQFDTYLIDTTLNKNILDKSTVFDSLGQKSYTYNLGRKKWEHFQPNTITYVAAPIAEMLYKESKRNAPIPTSISANWGEGEWILDETLGDLCRYFKTDIEQTDSTYVIWQYIQYTKPGNILLLSAYMYSKMNVRLLSYGYVFRAEYKKSDTEYYRVVEGYFVDKFGSPIWEIEEEYSNDDKSLQKILKKANKK